LDFGFFILLYLGGSATGNRTPVTGMRIRRPNR
jgi:hypothetical protein